MTEKREVRTIDVTPTWEAILPSLLLIYEDAKPQGRAMAKIELLRMAQIADLYVKEHRDDENR